MKYLIHITAHHPKKPNKTVDLYYYSVKQARYFNPHLIEFKETGHYVMDNQLKLKKYLRAK